MTEPRHMISYDAPSGRFNLRAAAVVLREGYLLVTRTMSEAFWYLPGGRVEWGEATRAAVAREVEEELGVAGVVGELAIVLENFFTHEGRRCHELAYYFAVSVPGSFPFRVDGEVCHRSRDGAVELEFKWIKAEAAILRSNSFKPDALCGELSVLPTTVRHLVVSSHAGDWEPALG